MTNSECLKLFFHMINLYQTIYMSLSIGRFEIRIPKSGV
jgi:hypothetical protein